MSDTDFDALADNLKEQDNSDSNDYESELPEEVEQAPILNVTPQCAIAFDEIVSVGMAGGVTDEQNIRVANGYSNDLVVTLKGPSVDDGVLYAATNGAAADYKLVDMDNDNIEVDAEKDGDEWVETGIAVYGSSFESEEVEDFEEDFVRLFIGSAAGMRLAQVLDVHGDETAYFDGEDKTSGLIEYPPRYFAEDHNPPDDGYPRLARTPTLRSDMRGEDGTLFFYPDEENGTNGNAMHKVVAFNGAADIENALSPATEDDELGEPEYPSYIVWEGPGDGGDTDEDGSNEDISMDALEEDDTDEGDTIEISEVSDLPDAHQSFVEKARDSIDASENDIKSIYKQFCDDNGLDVVGAEIVVDAIEG